MWHHAFPVSRDLEIEIAQYENKVRRQSHRRHELLGGLAGFGALSLIGSAVFLSLPPTRVHHAFFAVGEGLGILSPRAAAPLDLPPAPAIAVAELPTTAPEVAPVEPPRAPVPVVLLAATAPPVRTAPAVAVRRAPRWVAPAHVPAVALDRSHDPYDPYDDPPAQAPSPSRAPKTYEPDEL